MRKARTAAQNARRNFIIVNWSRMSDAEMADALQTARVNVAKIRRRLNLQRDTENIKAINERGRNKHGWRRSDRDYFY